MSKSWEGIITQEVISLGDTPPPQNSNLRHLFYFFLLLYDNLFAGGGNLYLVLFPVTLILLPPPELIKGATFKTIFFKMDLNQVTINLNELQTDMQTSTTCMHGQNIFCKFSAKFP